MCMSAARIPEDFEKTRQVFYKVLIRWYDNKLVGTHFGGCPDLGARIDALRDPEIYEHLGVEPVLQEPGYHALVSLSGARAWATCDYVRHSFSKSQVEIWAIESDDVCLCGTTTVYSRFSSPQFNTVTLSNYRLLYRVE
jgi:hypothetical protein